MNRLTRRFVVASLLAALIALPFQSVQACITGELYEDIVFEDAPDNIPSGLFAKHFHLTNQVPEFESWRKPKSISFQDKNVEMRQFSFIGMGASINPWTYWFTSRLPDWMVSKPEYIPIFAPTSSCSVRFHPLEQKIDREVLLVGKTLLQTNGEPAFAASSYRSYDGLWKTYNSQLGSY